jgi:DNA-directed RNA polymerase subunit RPC12/RpoP
MEAEAYICTSCGKEQELNTWDLPECPLCGEETLEEVE